MQINLQIEGFLEEYEMAATKFGRLAAGDPRLVLDMRAGRQIGLQLGNRISGFISGYQAAKKHAVLVRSRELNK